MVSELQTLYKSFFSSSQTTTNQYDGNAPPFLAKRRECTPALTKWTSRQAPFQFISIPVDIELGLDIYRTAGVGGAQNVLSNLRADRSIQHEILLDVLACLLVVPLG